MEQEDKDSWKALKNLGLEADEVGDALLNNFFFNTLPFLVFLFSFHFIINRRSSRCLMCT